jgi:hypothetical protein
VKQALSGNVFRPDLPSSGIQLDVRELVPNSLASLEEKTTQELKTKHCT